MTEKSSLIPRIKHITPLSDYKLYAEFDDGRKVRYDLADDIATLPNYSMPIGTTLWIWRAIQFMSTARRCEKVLRF